MRGDYRNVCQADAFAEQAMMNWVGDPVTLRHGPPIRSNRWGSFNTPSVRAARALSGQNG
jgi:hypothetical protein